MSNLTSFYLTSTYLLPSKLFAQSSELEIELTN